MKLKETLNLGKTAFPMRAGLPNKEPKWQKEWEEADIYAKRQQLNKVNVWFLCSLCSWLGYTWTSN